MALVQVFNITESEDGSTIYVSDETGTYDAISNPGGYGAPNTERSDVALIILGKYKATAGDTDLTPDAYDPEDVTQFVFSGLERDGYHQFLIYTVDKYVAQPATLNTFVYEFSANQLQRGNGAAFVSAEDSELEDNDIANNTQDWPHIPDLFRAKNYLNKLLLINPYTSTKRTELKEFLVDTEIVSYGVIALFGEESYTTAQEQIEKYQSRVDTILELT